MSINLSSVANTEFDAEVKQAYQGAGKLRNTVTLRTGVVGDTFKFRYMGKGYAQQRPAPSSDVTPMDVSHSQPSATLTNWYAPEYTDIFDDAEVNFEEQRELAMCIASALGRREDQLILNAVDAATAIAGTVSEDTGGTDSGMNVDKLRRASRYLNAKGVPQSDRFLVHHALSLEYLLGDTEAVSADYNSVRALVNGDINSFVGFNFVMLEDRTEGGIADESSEQRAFAWHKQAVGHAVGLDVRQETNYIPEKVSWLANGILKCGSVARDGEGIVEIELIET